MRVRAYHTLTMNMSSKIMRKMVANAIWDWHWPHSNSMFHNLREVEADLPLHAKENLPKIA